MHPALYIVFIVAAYVVLMIVFALSRGNNSHFVCPKCGFDFQVKGVRYLFSPKTFNTHYVCCPNCGYRGFTEVLAGKE